MNTVSKIIKKLLIEQPYYGLFLCGLKKEWSDEIETAGVCLDGINYKLLINEKWWKSLSPDIQTGVILHEALHLVFYHVLDKDKYKALCPNHMMLNVAHDLEVQSYIPEKYRWKECAAEQLFAQYPNLERKLGTKFYIEFLKQIQKEQQKKQPGSGSDTMDLPGEKDDHSEWGDLSDTQKSLAKAQLDYQQKEAAEQTLKQRGKLPSELEEQLKALLHPKPPIFNWKAYFRRFLGNVIDVNIKRTRRKESNRFEDATGVKKLKKHSILVAIDTSGSIVQTELQDFFSEIYHIWKAGAKVHVLECDAKIQKEYDYNGKYPEFVSGRGGTSFVPCVNYFNEHKNDYTTMVYFTDGWGDAYCCKPNRQMLWIITSNGNQEEEYPGIKICIPKNNKQ